MLQLIKDHIKTKPRLYDFFNTLRPLDDELEKWIDNFSKSHNGAINFIQVGASDGLRWDPIRRFIIRDNWNGVLIEPLKPVYNMLLSNYSYVKNHLKFENCAVSEKETSIEFWSYTEEFLNSLSIEDKLFYLRKSSLDKGKVEDSLSGIKNHMEYIKCYETPSKPLSKIISSHFPNNKIDLIFIDAEGFDDHVIRTINFENCMPTAIVYENHNLGERNEEIEDYLSEKGYVIEKAGGDTVAELNSNRVAGGI
jgi:FkbM family methyltransferase